MQVAHCARRRARLAMDLWIGPAIFVLFGVVVGAERERSRGIAPRPGWRGSEGVRLLTCITIAPSMSMSTIGASARRSGDPVGLIVMAVFGLMFVAAWWYWLDALWVTRGHLQT